jgi:hypothetical protein
MNSIFDEIQLNLTHEIKPLEKFVLKSKFNDSVYGFGKRKLDLKYANYILIIKLLPDSYIKLINISKDNETNTSKFNSRSESPINLFIHDSSDFIRRYPLKFTENKVSIKSKTIFILFQEQPKNISCLFSFEKIDTQRKV